MVIQPPGIPRRAARAAARRQAGLDGDGGAQCPSGPRAAQDEAGQRPHHPQPGLDEIQRALGLQQAPLRIECYDVSNLQGSDVVASMVVFEDGLARKSEYRRFTIRGIDGPERRGRDLEVITRRFRRYLEARAETGELVELDIDPDDDLERIVTAPQDDTPGPPPALDPETGRPRRFAYPPQLVVVDGGAPQVAAAQRALLELGIDDVALCGLAKRLEEVWLPDSNDPVVLPRTSEGLYLLQRVRDEAHRFAIAHHRQRRSKSMTRSALDGVPGLGDVRRRALLRHFGSLRRLAAASADEIAAVPGFGPRTAHAVVQAMADQQVGRRATVPAINTATGEILDDSGHERGREDSPEESLA